MRRSVLMLCALALFVLPASSVFAGLGNGAVHDHQLANAERKIEKLEQKTASKIAKLEQKIERLEQRTQQRIDKLQALLDQALAIGDWEEALELEQAILDHEANLERKRAQMQAKIVKEQQKCDAKVLQWQLKWGVPPPPPPP